jgi:hypothetical protein
VQLAESAAPAAAAPVGKFGFEKLIFTRFVADN